MTVKIKLHSTCVFIFNAIIMSKTVVFKYMNGINKNIVAFQLPKTLTATF